MSAIHDHLSQDVSGLVMVGRNLSHEKNSSVDVYDAYRALMFAANELIPLLGEPLQATDKRYLSSAQRQAHEALHALAKIVLPELPED
jgi:hypothetical protein